MLRCVLPLIAIAQSAALSLSVGGRVPGTVMLAADRPAQHDRPPMPGKAVATSFEEDGVFFSAESIPEDPTVTCWMTDEKTNPPTYTCTSLHELLNDCDVTHGGDPHTSCEDSY